VEKSSTAIAPTIAAVTITPIDHFFAKEQRYPISDIDKVYFYYVQTPLRIFRAEAAARWQDAVAVA